MLERVVAFVRENPDCTVTDIADGVPLPDPWELLCKVDTPGFPIISTSGGSAERGHQWRFRVEAGA